jgi:hypothetical protein
MNEMMMKYGGQKKKAEIKIGCGPQHPTSRNQVRGNNLSGQEGTEESL